MNRLSEWTFTCGCGRTTSVTPAEIATWQAPPDVDLWRIVEVMKALRARVDHEPCNKQSTWAIEATAKILDRDPAYVREKYEEYLEWLEGR